MLRKNADPHLARGIFKRGSKCNQPIFAERRFSGNLEREAVDHIARSNNDTARCENSIHGVVGGRAAEPVIHYFAAIVQIEVPKKVRKSDAAECLSRKRHRGRQPEDSNGRALADSGTEYDFAAVIPLDAL